MVSVVIAALSGTASIGTAGLMDALNKADLVIVDNGDVITSGGATAFLNLVLYLVERFVGHDHANLAAKVLLVDGHRPSQLPYIAFGRERSHDDELVHQVQQYIDLHLDGPLQVSELATLFGLSTRTLSRRFTAATGCSPRAYLQHARVQEAIRLLETTSHPVDLVRRAVGYTDAAAFRRVFKNATGLSPVSYRDAYGLRNGPAQLETVRHRHAPVPRPRAGGPAAQADQAIGRAATPRPGPP